MEDSMNTFCVGDKVRCIDPVANLIHGFVYEVIAVDRGLLGFAGIWSDLPTFASARFESVNASHGTANDANNAQRIFDDVLAGRFSDAYRAAYGEAQ
jgi:hypothetical protein